MTLRDAILDELLGGWSLRVPELKDSLLDRDDLGWWQRIYLRVLWPMLYTSMRRMEDEGAVESFQVPSAYANGRPLTAWRLPGRLQ